MRGAAISSWLLLGSGVLLGGCPFDPTAAEGLACRRDVDCGPKLECRAYVCRDPEADDDDTGVSTTGQTATTSSNTQSTTMMPSTSGEDPTCLPAGGNCATGTCCPGSSCVLFTYTDGSSESLCSATCGLGGNCVSCCCLTTDLGEQVCAFSEFCEGDSGICPGGSCGLGGSPCVQDGDCCEGVCASTVGGDRLCFTPCVDASECRSGCCSDAGSTPGVAFCQPAAVCDPYGQRASGIDDFAAMAARP